jgi:Uma2 family endonuclease
LGVRELWLVDLERSAIEQRVLVDGVWVVVGTFEGAVSLESRVFPGLRAVPDVVFGPI